MQPPASRSEPPAAAEVRSKLADIDHRVNRSMEAKFTSRWCHNSRAEPWSPLPESTRTTGAP
jgi:hypothetical protein